MTKDENKRIINIRPLFLVFISITVGILLMYDFLSKLSVIGLGCSFVIFLSTCILFIVFTILYVYKNKHEYLLKLSSKYIFVLIIFVSFVFGAVLGFLNTNKFSNLTHYRNFDCQITARVKDVKNNQLVLKNIIVNGTTQLKSGCTLYLDENSDFVINIGDNVEMAGAITLNPLYNNNINVAKYLSSNAYEFKLQQLIHVQKGGLTFAQKVRSSVKNLLSKHLNVENVEVSMSMLFGVKDEFPYHISEAFSLAGVSHILAVSGLHVGVIIAVIMFILSKFSKRKTWVHFAIVFAVLLCYCYLCDFSFSVLRASIMALVLLFAGVIGKRYDMLSSLSLAGILVLLIYPLAVFSVGFQMSFICVFAIITLAPFINKMLKNISLPNYLSTVLSMSLATNIVLLPLVANIFNKVSLISIISNIFIIPLFMVAFVLLIALVLVNAVLPLGFLFVIPVVLLQFLKLIATWLSNVPHAFINIFHVGYTALFIILIMAFIIKYLMIHIKAKTIIVSTLMVVVVVTMSVANLATHTPHSLMIDYQPSSNFAFLTGAKNNVSLVGFDRNTYYINKSIISNRIKNINTIIAYDFELGMLPSLNDFAKEHGVKKIYLPSAFENIIKLENLPNDCEVSFLKSNTHIDGYQVTEYLSFTNQTLAVGFTAHASIIFIKKLNNADYLQLANSLEGTFDYIVCNTLKYDISDYVTVNNVIYHNVSHTLSKNSVDLYTANTFTLKM